MMQVKPIVPLALQLHRHAKQNQASATPTCHAERSVSEVKHPHNMDSSLRLE
jgi:hypothetical protein